MDFHVSRRLLIGTAAAVPIMLFTSVGRSQNTELLAARDQLIERLPLAFPRSGMFASDQASVNGYLQEEASARRDFAEALSSQPRDEIANMIPPDQLDLAFMFDRLDVPLVPSIEQIVPLDPSIASVADDESVLALVIDILIQTFELEGIREVLKLVCTEYEPVRLSIERLSVAIGARDVNLIVRGLVLIVQHVISADALAFLVNRLGKERAEDVFKRMLSSTAKRFVPLIGWALVAASFVVVVVSNRERILRVAARN